MALTQDQKNLLLAADVFDQIPEVIRQLVSENVDKTLPQRVLNKQYDTVMNYIVENMDAIKGAI